MRDEGHITTAKHAQPTAHSPISFNWLVKLDPKIRQEALQMQRDRATHQKYEISHLKRLAIGE